MTKAITLISLVEQDFEYRTLVAEEIYRQLGGRKFAVMTGAKNFIGDKDSLSFKIGRNKTAANYVKIVLNWKDLYDIAFYQIRRTASDFRPVLKELKTYNDIHFDQLQKIFTEFTGMATHL